MHTINLYSLPIYLQGSKGFCSSASPIQNMVSLCNRWWDHVGCKWSQVGTNHMLTTSSLRMWELQEGRRCDAKDNVNKCIHCKSPKVKKLVITLWWGASIGSYANLAITRRGDGERSGTEIEANCKEKPYFFGQNFQFFFPPLYDSHPTIDFFIWTKFHTQKNVDSKVYLQQNIHLKCLF